MTVAFVTTLTIFISFVIFTFNHSRTEVQIRYACDRMSGDGKSFSMEEAPHVIMLDVDPTTTTTTSVEDRSSLTIKESINTSSEADTVATTIDPPTPVSFTQEGNPKYHNYIICNGISNQILIHAANIAYAIQQKKEGVNIPNVFIVDGTQRKKNKEGILLDVVPTKDNTIELASIFDTQDLIRTLNDKYNLEVRLVQPNPKLKKCRNWLQTLQDTEDHVINEIISLFKPSAYSQSHVDAIMKPLLQEGRKIQNGVCLHHRGGDNWMEYCKIWTNIGDDIWRKNCNTERNRALHMTFTPLLQN